MRGKTPCRIRLIHTFFWALFATSIVAIPIVTALGRYDIGLWLTLLASVEVVTLLINGMRCPLTGIAARYAEDRPVGFDIFLPQWLARYNKLISARFWFWPRSICWRAGWGADWLNVGDLPPPPSRGQVTTFRSRRPPRS